MTKKSKVTRAELKNRFAREMQTSLDRVRKVAAPGNFSHVHHEPIDKEIDRLRNEEITVGDLIRFGNQLYRVIERSGRFIRARHISTHDIFNFLIDHRIVKI